MEQSTLHTVRTSRPTMRRAIEVGSLVWAVVALSVGLATLKSYNSDARLLVISASVIAAACAALGAVTLAHHRNRLTGMLLLISCIAPTSFAWVVNVPALVVGAMLLLVPSLVLDSRMNRGPDAVSR